METKELKARFNLLQRLSLTGNEKFVTSLISDIINFLAIQEDTIKELEIRLREVSTLARQTSIMGPMRFK